MCMCVPAVSARVRRYLVSIVFPCISLHRLANLLASRTLAHSYMHSQELRWLHWCLRP